MKMRKSIAGSGEKQKVAKDDIMTIATVLAKEKCIAAR